MPSSPAPHPSAPHPSANRILGGAALVLAAATLLMLAEIEPVSTWYYSLAWYATIAIVDAWGHRRDPSVPMLVTRPRVFASLVFWSAVFWLFFELWNLRLRNWYYVAVPAEWWARRIGVFVAFGTVLPGIFAFDKWLAAHRFGEGRRTRGWQLPAWLPAALVAVGCSWAIMVAGWPRLFYPLVWGITVLVLAPWNRAMSGAGLLVDLERGDWRHVLRLLVAGMLCGLVWELANVQAGSKWIYTVPGFEELKLFEMPVLGFLGFPPFALECYVMYRSVVLLGVARDWEPAGARGREVPPVVGASCKWLRVAQGAVALGAGIILLVAPPLMDRYTVDSYRSDFASLPAVSTELAQALQADGVRGWGGLYRHVRRQPQVHQSLQPDQAKRVVAQVEMARLKTLGAQNVARLVSLGVEDLASLAAADAGDVYAALRQRFPDHRTTPARVRLWVRAARRALAGGRIAR